MLQEGYTPVTTFWQDFSIADNFGPAAVMDTYNSIQLDQLGYKELTELVLVLNWKIWQLYENYPKLARVYNDLWVAVDGYACDHLQGEELSYFYRTLD